MVDLDVPPGAEVTVEGLLLRLAQTVRFSTEPHGVVVGAVRVALVDDASGETFLEALNALRGTP